MSNRRQLQKLFMLSEWRQNRPLLLFSLLALLLGQLGILQLEFLGEMILQAQKNNARNLLGGDYKFRSKLPFTPEQLAELKQNFPQESKWSSKTSTLTMARVGDKSRLLEVNFVSSNFPLAGEFRYLDFHTRQVLPLNFAQSSTDHPVAYIEGQGELISNASTTAQPLTIGGLDVLVAGEIVHNPQQDFQMGALGPKLYLNEVLRPQADLLRFGSLASYTLIAEVAKNSNQKDPDFLSKEFTQWLKGQSIRHSSVENVGGRSDRVVKNLKDYIMLGNLISWIISLLGGFFFFLLYSQFIFSKLALYYVQGTSRRKLFSLYSLHFLALSLITTVAGLGLAYGLSTWLFPVLTTQLNFVPETANTLSPYLSWPKLLLKSFSIGPLFVLLLLPLFWSHFIQRGIRTYLLAESQKELTQFSPNPLYWVPLVLYLAGMTLWLTRSSVLMGALLGGLVTLLFLHWLLFKLFLLLLVPLAQKYFSNGTILALLKLKHFQGQSLLLITTLAFSLALAFSLGHVEKGMQNFFLTNDPTRPDFFLIDIDPSQVDDLKKLTSEHGTELYEISPMIKARPSKLKDRPISEIEPDALGVRERERSERLSRHTLNLSYRAELGLAETLLQGVPLSEAPMRGELIPLSLEEGYAKRLEVKLGDTYELDVLGMPVKTYVANIRRVRWSSFLPNFFAIAPPGHLENAPQNLIAVLKLGQLSPTEVDALLTRASEQFPNVNFLDLRRMLKRLGDVLLLMESTIKILLLPFALTSLFLFIVLLYFSIKNNEQRMALFKVQGASQSLLQRTWLAEYGLLFSLISFFALAEGLIVSKLLASFLFDDIWLHNVRTELLGLAGLFILFSLPYLILQKGLRNFKTQARKLLEGA